MNFTLIPFFLAANMAVNDTNEWIHGPEYTFHANLTYRLSTDVADEPFFRTNLTTTMKCRPASSDKLLCSFGSIIMEDSVNEQSPGEAEFEHPLLIKFNERGIESLLFPESIHSEELNTIRSIVKELSVGADFTQHAHALPAFVAKENYVLGECATLFTVLEYENQGLFGRGRGEERNYDLRVLSLPEQKAESVVVVEKRTEYKRCVKQDDSLYTRQGLDVKRKKSISKMHISANMFKSQTEMLVKMRRTMGKKDFVIQDITCVELIDIKPAKEKLPPLAFQGVATLPYSEGMEHNFLI